MLARYKLGEETSIAVARQENNFDRACDEACRIACATFGLDLDGYFMHVEEAGRDATITVQFIKYTHCGSMTGHSHTYEFTAKVE